MTTRWARLARGFSAAIIAIFVAAFCHTAAGGVAPSLIALALSLAFSTLVCVGLTGRSPSWWRQSASVAVSQLTFHLFFCLGSGDGSIASSGHHGASATLVVENGPVGHAHTMSFWDPWMLASHALAGIVTVVILRFGEDAFWKLCESARYSICLIFFPPVEVTVFPRTGSRPPVLARVLGLSTLCPVAYRRRGPPFVTSFSTEIVF
jgi:hypothetical protein